ncbi:MAG TPA: MauE/DoxX family redox-associated membrane protein [Acidimicrobiales bacterium]|nr:MauE/DoxX family redox-associated membrane protein [Acidimicrobiales bacterium]
MREQRGGVGMDFFQVPSIAVDLASAARGVLVGVLVIAVVGKLADRGRFSTFLCSLGLSSSAARKARVAVIAAELLTIAGLLVGSATIAGLAVAWLFGVFFVGLVVARRRGVPGCACLGRLSTSGANRPIPVLRLAGVAGGP